MQKEYKRRKKRGENRKKLKIEKLKINTTLNSVLNKIIIFCISLIMCYNLIYIIFSNLNKKFEFGFGSYLILIVEDNTMAPTINNNDIIVVEKIVEDDIKKGDVIVTNESKRKVARVEKNNSSDEKNTYLIKGDNNYFYYEDEIELANIIGKVKKVFPKIGLFLKFCQSKIITILTIMWLFIKFNHYKIKLEDSKRKKAN